MFFEGSGQSYLDNYAKIYRNDSVSHPLIPFYLSYSEWETIGCIVAIDSSDFWNKAMIALIENSGKLRISYKNRKIYLDPVRSIKMEKGKWTSTFKNDSLEIQFSVQLRDINILRCIGGTGSLVLKHNDKIFRESAYFVYEKRN